MVDTIHEVGRFTVGAWTRVEVSFEGRTHELTVTIDDAATTFTPSASFDATATFFGAGVGFPCILTGPATVGVDYDDVVVTIED